MNRVALVLQTPAVALSAFEHPAGTTHTDPDSEVAARDSINFVEGGTFDVHMAKRRWQIDATHLFVAERGMEFTCTHDCESPTDRCLCVTFEEGAVEDLRQADIPRLRPPVVELSARHHYLRHRLRTCGTGHEMRLELLAAALYESLAVHEAPLRVPAHERVTPLMRQVDRAVELMESDYGRALTLRDIASAAGMSPFHFARVFRAMVGVPPHRYLTAIRLRHAAQMIGAGAGVTHTCYEVGFGSLSHFVTAFKKRFGINPGEAKGGAPCPTLRSSLRAPLWSVQRV